MRTPRDGSGRRARCDAAPEGRGIYVHIPFCLAKCAYCDFNSYPTERGVPDWYVAALARDIAGEAAKWIGRFTTVYFGGGTPSLLRADQAAAIMRRLRGAFDLAPKAEVTLECNPATATQASLEAYRESGVNRLSVGVQSLSGMELEVLGRRHDAAQALATLEMARRAGYANVSADVMLGIPGQTEASLKATLAAVVGHVTHVSAYMLSLEPGTALADSVSRGSVRGPGDDLLADLYEVAAGTLDMAGLPRYEISNFARGGNACRHNLNYWRRGDYVGLGAGAHSHRDGRRYAKTRSPEAYREALAGAEAAVRSPNGYATRRAAKVGAPSRGAGHGAGSVIEFEEGLSNEQKMLEELMLGLRTTRGISGDFPEKWAPAGGAALGRALEGLASAGLLVKRSNAFALSPKGFLLHDAVSAEIASAVAAPSAGAPSLITFKDRRLRGRSTLLEK